MITFAIALPMLSTPAFSDETGVGTDGPSSVSPEPGKGADQQSLLDLLLEWFDSTEPDAE